MYVAEFKRVYDHNTKKYGWQVEAVFDMNLKDIFVEEHNITKSAIDYIKFTHPTDFAFKLIDEDDITICGSRMYTTTAVKKFDTYKDY